MKRLRALSAALLVACCPPVIQADERKDHDYARQAVDAGEVLPLRTILDRVERSHPGQVIDVGLEREPRPESDRNGGRTTRRDRWVYKLKILRPGGALLKLRVDARTGAILDNRDAGAGVEQTNEGGGGSAHSGR